MKPNKPRLRIDARFVNLRMSDTPFSLDTLVSVPRYAYPGSFLPKIDDKSGYDHILLATSSQELFGLKWKGWWFWEQQSLLTEKIPRLYTKLPVWPRLISLEKWVLLAVYISTAD